MKADDPESPRLVEPQCFTPTISHQYFRGVTASYVRQILAIDFYFKRSFYLN